MRFRDICSRLTGISVPIFGISWNPPEAERCIAKRVMTFMEDRRVLYTPSEMEMPAHCLNSVLKIRRHLTDELSPLDNSSELQTTLRALRAACHKFMNTVQRDDVIIQSGSSHNHWASWEFNGALGEMRGVFGVHLAILATKYGLDVEGELANILPVEEKPSDGGFTQ